jgi:hypothetical protein
MCVETLQYNVSTSAYKLSYLNRIGSKLACKETHQLLSYLVEAPNTSNFLCLGFFLFLRVVK